MSEPEYLFVLGARIRELRREKGMTQHELANLCKLEKANISRIESGKTNMTIDSLFKICKALEVKLKDIFTD